MVGRRVRFIDVDPTDVRRQMRPPFAAGRRRRTTETMRVPLRVPFLSVQVPPFLGSANARLFTSVLQGGSREEDDHHHRSCLGAGPSPAWARHCRPARPMSPSRPERSAAHRDTGRASRTGRPTWTATAAAGTALATPVLVSSIASGEPIGTASTPTTTGAAASSRAGHGDNARASVHARSSDGRRERGQEGHRRRAPRTTQHGQGDRQVAGRLFR